MVDTVVESVVFEVVDIVVEGVLFLTVVVVCVVDDVLVGVGCVADSVLEEVVWLVDEVLKGVDVDVEVDVLVVVVVVVVVVDKDDIVMSTLGMHSRAVVIWPSPVNRKYIDIQYQHLQCLESFLYTKLIASNRTNLLVNI